MINLQICVCHIKKAGSAPFILVFLPLILQGLILFDLRILLRINSIGEVDPCTEAHFGYLVVLFKTFLELYPFVRVKSIVIIAAAVVKSIADISVFLGFFDLQLIFLTKLR